MEELVSRVRKLLPSLGDFGHLGVRPYGQHILIEPRASKHPRDRDAVARLTVLGHEAYGLSFRKLGGGWEPIVLIDALEEILAAMTDAMGAELSPPAPAVHDAA